MANNILKEAIADAKAVREVALANAKAALEEAFTPKLQSMLSAKLSEELDEEMYDEDMYEDMYDEDMDEMHGMHDEDMDEVMLDMDEEIDIDEMEMDMEEEESTDEDIDLDEILNELELEEGDDEDEEQIDEMGKPNYKAEYVQTQHSYKADDVMENKEFDLDALLNEINNLENNKIVSKKPIKVIPPPSARNANQVLKEANLPEAKVVFCKEEKTNIKNLAEQLNEAEQALLTVKGELNEVNLLNSKLLYVNRIFKANNLDDSQKLRVVETLDNAGTIKEAKLIYETIKDTFNVVKSTTKTTPKKSIREGLGMASKAAGTSTAPKKTILNESNDMVTRMQKLANITINE